MTTNKGNKYLEAHSKMPKSFLRYELLDEAQRFHPSIEISRGCGRGCSFCLESNIALTQAQEPVLVIENFKYLRKVYNEEPFFTYLEASNFCPSQKWALQLYREYKKNNLDNKWRCEIRVDTISAETLNILSRSGLKVLDVGLESASKSQLKRMNKTKKPAMYLEKADLLLIEAAKLGVFVKLNIMFYPGESHKTIQETISWLNERKDLIKGVSVGSLILFGTEIERNTTLARFEELGTSLAKSNPDDPEGVNRLNLSNEITSDVADKYSSDICKMFMSDKDYYDLKSFCYFPRDYSYIDYKADMAKT